MPAIEPLSKADYDSRWEELLFRDTTLVPLYLAKTTSDSSGKGLLSEELINYTASFYERSWTYHMFWSWWLDNLQDEKGPEFVNYRSTISIFAPIYIQELEGPMRYQISALIHLMDAERGEDPDWHSRLYNDGSRRYFGSVLSQAINISKQLHGIAEIDLLNDGYENLTDALILLSQNESLANQYDTGLDFSSLADDAGFSSHPNSGAIRNALAHANYYYDFDTPQSDDRYLIEFDDNTASVTAEGLILYLGKHLSLMLGLTTGITLGLLYLATLHEHEHGKKILSTVLPFDIEEEYY